MAADTDAAQLGAAAIQALLGVVALLLGAWGRRAAPDLIPPTTAPEQREHLQVAYRRGGWAASAVGLLLLLSALAATFAALA